MIHWHIDTPFLRLINYLSDNPTPNPESLYILLHRYKTHQRSRASSYEDKESLGIGEEREKEGGSANTSRSPSRFSHASKFFDSLGSKLDGSTGEKDSNGERDIPSLPIELDIRNRGTSSIQLGPGNQLLVAITSFQSIMESHLQTIINTTVEVSQSET